MSVHAQPTAPAVDQPPSHERPAAPPPAANRLARTVAWLEARALFVTAVAVVVALSAAGIPAHLNQDGYLALVAGRIIAAHGIPHRDYLTVMAHGVRWVDQQWLAQLIMYGLTRLGGLPLLTVTYVLITSAAFGLAIAAGRSLDARDIHVLAMLPLGTFFYLATAVSIRTQGFAYPLFIATVWLLATESRRPSRRALAVFPLLVLWANLHGSVSLGVGLAMLYGAAVLLSAYRSDGVAGLIDIRGLGFLLGAPLTLFATPYGPSIVHYYRVTLLNPAFGKLIAEWQPVTSFTILAVPLLLLILGCVWALGRSGRRSPAFDQLALAMLALGAIFAVRNITWFGLGVMVLMPATITQLRPDAPPGLRRARVNLGLALAAMALAALVTLTTLGRPTSWFQSSYPRGAVAVLQRIVDRRPATKIFADIEYADWMVWQDPRLAGHIAYDTSLENLTDAQLAAIASLTAEPGPGVPNTLGPYSVLVLFPGNHATNRILLSRPGVHVILRSKHVVIATKPIT